MKLNKILLICLLTIPTISLCQTKNLLLGSWVKTKMEAYDKKVTPLIAKRDSAYLKYSFKNDGKVYFTNQYNEIGYGNIYSLNNDIIDLTFNKLKIESIDAKSLILIELENNQITPNSTRIYLIKESDYLAQIPIKPDDYYVVDNDTIFFECPKVFPIFNNKNQYDLRMFLQVNVEGLTKGKESFAYATLLINTDGKISNIKLHHHINKAYDKNIIKAIQSTEGFWVSPIVNGKKVKVIKEIEFMYVEFPDIREEGNALVLQHKNIIFPENYRATFKNAVKSNIKADYKSSLNFFTKCLELTSDKSNTHYQMSFCYEKLNDNNNKDKCIEEVKKSKLNYLIKK